MSRLDIQREISQILGQYDDADLALLLAKAEPLQSGIGGTTTLLNLQNHKVFIKKIALTDIERLPANCGSTANLFQLPQFYQYRLGSAGFGAWRELKAHQITTQWVATQCQHFPILYHWRLIAEKKQMKELVDLAETVAYWNNSAAVRERLKALNSASANLVLFLEYIPTTLHDWLAEELKRGNGEAAIQIVEKQLKQVLSMFEQNGFVHFDAHFKNILCNGDIYVSDFGLAASDQFELSEREKNFLVQHKSYDRVVAITSLVQVLIAHLYGEGKWREHLISFFNTPTPPSLITQTIQRYAPIAFALIEFYNKIDVDKLARYPAEEMEQLLNKIDSNI